MAVLTGDIAISIVSGERPQRSSTLDDKDDLDDAFSDVSDPTNSGSSESSDTRPKSELQQLQLAIIETITSLFKLSMSIRKPTPRDRYPLAASLAPYDAAYDIDHVYHKFPYTQLRPWFMEKVGRANAKRREIMRYEKRHHDKLAGNSMYDGLDAEYREAQLRNTTHRKRRKPILAGPSGETGSTASTDPLASTKATTFRGNLLGANEIELGTERSEASFISSIGDTTLGESRQVPDPPKESANGQPFECPYCYTIQRIKDLKYWK